MGPYATPPCHCALLPMIIAEWGGKLNSCVVCPPICSVIELQAQSNIAKILGEVKVKFPLCLSKPHVMKYGGVEVHSTHS